MPTTTASCSIVFTTLCCLILVLCNNPIRAGPANPPKLPTRDMCMYFSDDNGVAQALSFDPVQGALVEASLLNSTTTDLIDKGVLVRILENIGYRAVGLAIHDNILYVASLRLIARYNISDNLRRLDNFVEFAFIPFECLPGGLVAWDKVLYLTCGAFKGANLTYPILKFSLEEGPDYGKYLNATDYPSWAKLYFYQTGTINGTFWVNGYFSPSYGTSYPITGNFAFLSGGAGLFAIPLDNQTKEAAVSDLYVFAFYGYFGRQNTTTPIENVTSEFWYGFTWGEDGNIYQVRQYSRWGIDVGDVIAFDGTSGEYIFTLVDPTEDLAGAVGIQLGPTGDFYVASKSSTSASHIWVYDKITGKNKGAFYTGTPENDILPKEFIWGACPYVPPAPEETDNTLTIVLATVLPILGIPTLCVICLLIGVIIYLLVKEINDRRRRTYRVRDDARVQQGRRGKTAFTYREIDPEELEIGDLLGTGAFGKVYRGTFRGAPVAIKTFDQLKLDEVDEETLAEIREEAQLMEILGNHPNVISFVGAITNPSQKGHELYFSLVTEYCPNGSLFDFLIKKKTRLPLVTLIKMARDIAAGILHLHKEHVIHRDIASRNILVGNDLSVYLSDFGMARIKQQEVNTTVANIGPVKWMAPESMMHKQYSEASDAFSYGVLLWEMITRKVPWKGMDPAQIIIAVAQKNTRLEVPEDSDPILKKIIKAVWRSAPEKRMTMSEIVSKLDTYYKSLVEVYEDMSSSDDEGHTDRNYFKYNSSDRSSRSAMLSAPRDQKKYPQMQQKSADDSENGTEMSDMSFSYAEISTDNYNSMDSMSKGGKGKGKGKGKEKDVRGKGPKVEKNYGEIPMPDKNYGEIPMPDKNYGEIPMPDKNYGFLPSDV